MARSTCSDGSRRTASSAAAAAPSLRSLPCRRYAALPVALPEFNRGAFDELPEETLAVVNNYEMPVAAVSKNTLRLNTDDDGLVIDIDLPDPTDNDTTRVILDVASATEIYARPYIAESRSEYAEQGELRVFSKAWIRAIILSATDFHNGLEPAEIAERRREAERRHHRDRERIRTERSLRSRRIWL